MKVSAQLIKELRKRTDAGIMECKKFLRQTDGDIDRAIDLLREHGRVKAAKRQGKIAAEGAIFTAWADDSYVMLEVNCETDFAAREDHFVRFGEGLVSVALKSRCNDVKTLENAQLSGQSVAQGILEMTSVLGEKVRIRRVCKMTAKGTCSAQYLHARRIGVVVDLEGGSPEVARDIAMHIAASSPLCVHEQDVAQDVLEREKSILHVQAQRSGKSAGIIEKIVQGRLKKFFKGIVLLEQAFVRDPDISVSSFLRQHEAQVLRFERMELGEGLEKAKDSFVDSVMSQIQSQSS